MEIFVPVDIQVILLTGYIIAFMALNLVAYLISSFYRKKFNQPSPRSGFLYAIVLIALYNASLFTGDGYNPFTAVLRVLLVFGGSIASAGTAASLYYTMKKARK